MLLAVGLIGMVCMIVVFGLALGARVAQEEPPVARRPTVAVLPSRFFASQPAGGAMAPYVEVSVEAFLTQLESHVRLESAAAENFIHQPTAQSLHAPTTSSLVN